MTDQQIQTLASQLQTDLLVGEGDIKFALSRLVASDLVRNKKAKIVTERQTLYYADKVLSPHRFIEVICFKYRNNLQIITIPVSSHRYKVPPFNYRLKTSEWVFPR